MALLVKCNKASGEPADFKDEAKLKKVIKNNIHKKGFSSDIRQVG